MTLFDSLFSSVGFPMLGKVFGEPAEYIYRSGIVVELDNVVVYRNPPELIDERGEVYQPTMTVDVPIDPIMVDTGGDKIKLKEHSNDVAFRTYTVTRLISQIGDMCNLEVR